MKRHARSLVEIIRYELGNPWRGAEIGVWEGVTSADLLREFSDLVLYCVDPWSASVSNPTMQRSQAELDEARDKFYDNVYPYKLRVRVCSHTSEQASRLLGAGSLNFAFIDGCHLYESVKQDISLWWPKVSIGGLLLGHDYNGVGDRRGRFGVKRAVDEFVVGADLTLHTAPGNIWWVKRTME